MADLPHSCACPVLTGGGEVTLHPYRTNSLSMTRPVHSHQCPALELRPRHRPQCLGQILMEVRVQLRERETGMCAPELRGRIVASGSEPAPDWTRMSARLRGLAHQTLTTVEAGQYVSPTGRLVQIRHLVEHAVANTRIYGPDPVDWQSRRTPGQQACVRIHITGETTLRAAARLAYEGNGPVGVLNFASARHPGGGFLNGAAAQEESLCRASALYPCLRACREYYEYHRTNRDPFYSDRVIYSPEVPVFRSDDGTLLESPYTVSFLTSAAPNAGVIRRSVPGMTPAIRSALQARTAQVLAVAVVAGLRRVVLGAWGCGVFENSPVDVAEAFRMHLQAGGLFSREFNQVVFAIIGPARGNTHRGAFESVFAGLHE